MQYKSYTVNNDQSRQHCVKPHLSVAARGSIPYKCEFYARAVFICTEHLTMSITAHVAADRRLTKQWTLFNTFMTFTQDKAQTLIAILSKLQSGQARQLYLKKNDIDYPIICVNLIIKSALQGQGAGSRAFVGLQ